ncbi:hypothetical protein PG275_10230 [Riemerella anatipestifer]|nr:hypothetical protein [Riemerella anatipestifer]
MRVNVRIGDVFSVNIGNGFKKYFQYVANDSTQLNSDVIRAFKETYRINSNLDLVKIVSGEIDFYAHCITKLGLKMKVWEKVGNSDEIGDITKILFRDTKDYGSEDRVIVSQNWYVWNINDKDFTTVGKLEGENRNAYIGIVINPLGIIELLKGNKYPVNYPEFE